MSLLEVMVAFVIAALSLGAVIGGTVDGVRTAGSATRTEEALSRARSRLAATAAAPAVVPAATIASGDDGGGFRWRTAVTPVATARAGGPTLLSIQVTVMWDGAGGAVRQVSLQTERLAAGTPP